MSRPARRIQSGLIYHVVNRGNRRQRIFGKDEDFQAFLTVLTAALARFDDDLLCWCIMGNHWHLVLRPRADGHLQRFMQWLTLTHARRHHGHHARATVNERGELTRLRAPRVDPPTRRDQSRAPRAWRPWLLQTEQWMDVHLLFKQLGSIRAVVKQTGYSRNTVRQMLPAQLSRVQQSLERDCPLGFADWTRHAAQALHIEQTLRPRGRPPKPLDELSPRQRRRRESFIKQLTTE